MQHIGAALLAPAPLIGLDSGNLPVCPHLSLGKYITRTNLGLSSIHMPADPDGEVHPCVGAYSV